MMNPVRFGAFQVITVTDAPEPKGFASISPEAERIIDEYADSIQKNGAFLKLGLIKKFPNTCLFVTGKHDVAQFLEIPRITIGKLMKSFFFHPARNVKKATEYAQKAFGEKSDITAPVELVRLKVNA